VDNQPCESRQQLHQPHGKTEKVEAEEVDLGEREAGAARAASVLNESIKYYSAGYASPKDTVRAEDATPGALKQRRHDWYSFFMMFTKFYKVVDGSGNSWWPSSGTVHAKFRTKRNEQIQADRTWDKLIPKWHEHLDCELELHLAPDATRPSGTP
jgi:hypothetical protein